MPMKNKEQQEALETADLSIWATSILMACGYALKEMLTKKASGDPGELYEQAMVDNGGFPIFDKLGNSILNEWADEMAQAMIYRAVEIFGIIDEHGFQEEDDIMEYLKKHDQQSQKQTDSD